MPEMRPDGASARVGATESFVTVAPAPVQRDARGRFTAGSGRPLRRRPGAQPANLNASRNAWRAFWQRRALRPADRWVLPLLSDYSAALVTDRGGPDAMTAGERSMIELATLARGCTMLVLAQAAAGGGIVGGRRSATIKGADSTRSLADPDLAGHLVRFMQVERSALQAIGMERRARPVKSLREVLMEAARETETSPASSSAANVAPAGKEEP